MNKKCKIILSISPLTLLLASIITIHFIHPRHKTGHGFNGVAHIDDSTYINVGIGDTSINISTDVTIKSKTDIKSNVENIKDNYKHQVKQ